MSSEGKYTNIEYQNFFEKNLSDTDPEIYKGPRTYSGLKDFLQV